MKSNAVIIGLLVLNLGVVAALLVMLAGEPPAKPSARPAGPVAGAVSAGDAAVSAASTSLPPAIVVVTNQFQWAQLESEDYHEYIARLRSIGCPDATIRDIIIADLDKLLAPQIQALYGRRPELGYWHSVEEELANDVDPREVGRKSAEIEKRKREIIRELVGADLARERMLQQGEEDFYERRLSFLPEDRRTQVRELLERYAAEEQKFRERELEDGEPLDAGDRARLRQLSQQRDAELAKVLEPQDKAKFDLWMSPAANEVRHALYGMNATEQEFLSAYEARRDFDSRWGDRDELLMDAASRAERDKDREAMETRIREKLGDERYALYQRGQDEDFHSLSALATRFKLPKEKAAEVYTYKKIAQDVRGEVLQNTELSEEQRRAALKAIAEETAGAVRAALGERAYRHYLRTGQGAWFQP